MKNHLSVFFVLLLAACSNNSENKSGKEKDTTTVQKSSMKSSGSCGNLLFFKEGAIINTSSYDGQGKEIGQQTATVTKVSQSEGMTVAEVAMKTKNTGTGTEREMNAQYKCDGKQLYVDLSGFMPGDKKGGKIETSGLLFPLDVSAGETLPDAEYSMNMNVTGKEMKMTSHIRERKVEAKEPITTAAGTFDCYRISSVIEVEMTGMDEMTKKVMDDMKNRMGKSRMIFWYAPGTTIIKMEYYMGDKLISRTEVTGIKN